MAQLKDLLFPKMKFSKSSCVKETSEPRI